VSAKIDALAGFPANEILFAAPMPRQRIWLEHDLERKAGDLFGVHISSLTVDADTGVSITAMRAAHTVDTRCSSST
jgi:hypothetical protein